MNASLPITPLLPAIAESLAQQANLVLQAPPGAGKTTSVPLALLDAPWLAQRKIIMLEPRRLATRNAAHRLAQQLGEKVGQRAGYRMRQEQQCGPNTQLEVVTEGILTRMLQDDPALEDVGLVIFDEFHERSLQADLGLALALDCQQGLREDLRLLVMSATLDGEAVAQLMNNAPILTSARRSHPVSIHYEALGQSYQQHWPQYCRQSAQAIARISQQHSSSILVFLPGMAEIRRIESHLQAFFANEIAQQRVSVTPLHGQLPFTQQQQAIEPCPAGQHKIVLATSIAETSLTIDGVDVVVDSGLMRVPRFDPNSGLTRLHTQRISKANAEQRAGRAGRLRPGHAYRLWPESTQLAAFSAAEILHADLCGLQLELARWGVHDAAQLCWLDAPPSGALNQAYDLLQQLQALDAKGQLTQHGDQLAQLGAHPRLAHMMVRAHELSLADTACALAAILEERDPWRHWPHADLSARLDDLLSAQSQLKPSEAKRLQQQAARWQRQLHQGRLRGNHSTQKPALYKRPEQTAHTAGLLLAYAYPDRIGRQRAAHSSDKTGTHGRFQLSNGRGARVNPGDALKRHEFIVAALVDDGQEGHIKLAASIDLNLIAQFHSHLLSEHEVVRWSERQQQVIAERQQHLGRLIVKQEALMEVSDEQISAGLLSGIQQQGIDCLPWDDASIALRQRLHFMHGVDPEHWPAMDDTTLLASAEHWLLPYLSGMRRLSHISRLKLSELLLNRLKWPQQQQLEQWAPSHWQAPSGSRIRLDYSHNPPIIPVRLQEVFGLQDTPRLAQGRVAVVMHLLSPARRPVQITQDLKAFWQSSYHDVKKEMKGRYPKHFWPDDPSQAAPTARAKPRK